MKHPDDISVKRAAYEAAKQKDTDLRHRLRSLEQRHDELQRTIGESSAHAPQERLSAAAVALLDDEGDDTPQAGAAVLRQELAPNREECRVLRRAIQLSERRVRDRHQAWSRAVSESKRAEHDKLVKQQTEALLALVEASAAVDRFRTEIEKAGADCTLRPVTLRHFGQLDDPNSHVRLYLRELVEYGFPVPDPADYGVKQW